MASEWEIEIEPEVRHWLDNLSDRDYLQAEHAAERLLGAPTTLSEPYSRHLGDGLRELRFMLGHDSQAIRLTYWLAPGRRIVLLTVFRKSKMREDAEVDRAQQARKACEAEGHTAHDEFSRTITMGDAR
ncbi:type II toxin-antitoxin system RelE/ParE family toxin [Actinacidiphila acididurans]|uniref:Type II toxin-antitoxin system RelE/ParE family toxin n=1 Tax=Actinacidiphila acididurans TaxID=2784346 RepID=A0ABS2TWN9_9ACTN|nr:type II toxin-antitoxin system RelE/ParE family toxin [Actinacidiphila acididurans]MBM9507760.1 type II toxin-antitoxin system RelE/ParE family toxin [Actinacidiphila acididurans]